MFASSDKGGSLPRDPRLAGAGSRAIGAAAIGTALFASLAIVLRHLGRGFNFTDEAYYLLGYRHPEDVRLALTSFHQVVARLAGLQTLTILQYRLLAVGLNVGSSALLGFAVAWTWKADHAQRLSLALRAGLWAVLGGMLQFSWGPRGLSYNNLGGALAYLECAAVLVYSAPRIHKARSVGIGLAGALLTGCLLGVHALVKAPTAALMGLVALSGILWTSALRGWAKAATVMLLGLGTMMAPLWFFTSVTSLAEWRDTTSSVQAAMGSLYSLRTLWLGTISTSLGAARRVVPVVALAAGLIVWAELQRRRGWPRLAVALELLALATGVGLVAASGHFRGLADEEQRLWIPHFTFMALLAAGWLAGGWADLAGRSACWASMALLALVPVTVAVGSSNILTKQMLFHLAPWFVLGALAQDNLTRRSRSVLSLLCPVLIGLIVVHQVYTGQVQRPFGIHGRMDEQTVELPGAEGSGVGLRVDGETSRFVAEVRGLLAAGGFKVGDRIWGIYDGPGLVYLAGGRAPQTPWIFSGKGTEALACTALERSTLDEEREFLILTKDPDPLVSECMRRSGRDIGSYRLLGSLPRPPLPFLEYSTSVRVLVSGIPISRP